MMLDEGLILAVLGHARRMGDLDLAHHAVFALEEAGFSFLFFFFFFVWFGLVWFVFHFSWG